MLLTTRSILLLAPAAAALLLSSCALDTGGTFQGEDATVEPDGRDQADLEISFDDTGDPPGDADFEFDFPETCFSGAQCDDGNPCNGEETCTDAGGCIPGAPPSEGASCSTTEISSGLCIEGVCIAASCGNGIIEELEQCDDGRDGDPEDGCRDDCTFSCQSSSHCTDDNACTIDVCISGGEGKLCAAVPVDRLCNDRNPCTVDDACAAGFCTGTDAAADLCDDGNDCTDDGCDTSSGCTHTPNSAPCNDGDTCTTGDTCSGGVCLGTAPSGLCPCGSGGPICSEYIDLDLCNGTLTCQAGNCMPDPSTIVTCDSTGDTRCMKNTCNPSTGTCTMTPVAGGERCDDQNACTHNDRCLSGTCAGMDVGYQCADTNECTIEGCDPGSGCTYAISTLPCNDMELCTTLDRCQDTGECAGTPYTCATDECATSSTCDGSGGCSETYTPPGSDCNDGASCSSNEACNGAGGCTGDLSDAACAPGEICKPLCFAAATGCGTPPRFLHMSCTDPVNLDLSSDSACTISLDSVGGQAPCIRCEAKQGRTQIELADFGDREGACDLDGWTLIPGPSCGTDYNIGSCTRTGAVGTCCADFNTICNELNGRLVLQTNKATNCGGGREEWRLTKSIDTTGVTDLTLCLDIGKSGAINNNEYLLIMISDSGHSSSLVCYDGDDIKNDIVLNADDTLFTVCYDLPSWADNNENVVVTVIANSNDINGQILYIDDIAIAGRSPGCALRDADLFSESFAGCPDPITDGWNGWRVTGNPICPGTLSCANAAEALGGTWTIEHGVDTSPADGNIRLSFELDDHGAGTGESVLVEFSTDGGSRWQTAWSQIGNIGTDDSCHAVVRNLSNIDIRAARNPDLKIRFTLASDDKKVDVDNIAVTGTAYCSAAGSLLLGPVTETAPAGRYEFGVRDLGGNQTSAVVFCSWDDPADPVWDISEILFKR